MTGEFDMSAVDNKNSLLYFYKHFYNRSNFSEGFKLHNFIVRDDLKNRKFTSRAGCGACVRANRREEHKSGYLPATVAIFQSALRSAQSIAQFG
jgi:hypothetical protein